MVDHPNFGFTILAIGRVYPRVSKAHPNGFERPLLASGVEAERHGCARPKCRKQEVVRAWAGVRSTDGDRFVRPELMPPYRDLLREAPRASVDHDIAGLGPASCLRRWLFHHWLHCSNPVC